MTTTMTDPMATALDVLETSRLDDATLRPLLHGLAGVDQVGVEGRAATLGARQIRSRGLAGLRS